jgi:hypothetical protein
VNRVQGPVLLAGGEKLVIDKTRFANAAWQKFLHEPFVILCPGMAPFRLFAFKAHQMNERVLTILSKDSVKSSWIVIVDFRDEFGDGFFDVFERLGSDRVTGHDIFHSLAKPAS